ncbi:MAG: DUF4240 domain-containing protein [Anaerolineales bacterium]|nr:DUF4240 domain-containing protein [Anaerolineales bacterium]
MNRELFWQLIEDSRAAADGDPYAQGQHLTAALAEMTLEDIAEFDALAHDLQDQAYSAELWEAFYVIEPGCNEDGFAAWRQWLIGQGRRAFERALLEPDTLAEVVPADQESGFELLLGVADEAYAQLTGDNLPLTLRPARPLRGELHANDADIFKRYPRLTAKFVSEEE